MSLVIDSPACGSLEALFEGVRLGIVAGEPRGRIRDANPEACRLLGVDQEALLAMDWERLLAMLGLPDGSSLPQEESVSRRPSSRALPCATSRREWSDRTVPWCG